MLSVTIPNISPSQNTPALPNIRRIVTRPSERAARAGTRPKLSLAPSSVLCLGTAISAPQDNADDAPSR